MSAELLNTEQASDYVRREHGINRQPRTLQLYRGRGTGPAYLRLGKHEVRYVSEDLDAWVESLKQKCRVEPQGAVA